MRHFLSAVIGIAPAALMALASPASAGEINVTGIELPYNDILTITAPVSGTAYVGQQVLTTATGATIDAWCIDLFHDDYVGGGQNLHYNTSSVFTDGHGNTLSQATIGRIAGLMEYGNSVLDHKLISPTTNLNDFSASIQLAIWTTEYSGFSYAGNDTLTQLVSADMTAAAPYGSNYTSLVSLDGEQSLAFVPEPASLALLGAGVVGLGALMWRRKSGTIA